jgi:hypothetical protein
VAGICCPPHLRPPYLLPYRTCSTVLPVDAFPAPPPSTLPFRRFLRTVHLPGAVTIRLFPTVNVPVAGFVCSRCRCLSGYARTFLICGLFVGTLRLQVC